MVFCLACSTMVVFSAACFTVVVFCPALVAFYSVCPVCSVVVVFCPALLVLCSAVGLFGSAPVPCPAGSVLAPCSTDSVSVSRYSNTTQIWLSVPPPVPLLHHLPGWCCFRSRFRGSSVMHLVYGLLFVHHQRSLSTTCTLTLHSSLRTPFSMIPYPGTNHTHLFPIWTII